MSKMGEKKEVAHDYGPKKHHKDVKPPSDGMEYVDAAHPSGGKLKIIKAVSRDYAPGHDKA